MTKYFDEFIKKSADKVYSWWEDNKFFDDGSGRINQVCQFSDWVDEVDNESLLSIGGIYCNTENRFDEIRLANKLRAVINKGIDNWLNDAYNYFRS